MKKIIILVFTFLSVTNYCKAQTGSTRKIDTSIPDNQPLFVIDLSSGKRIITREVILRSFEVDSLVEMPRNNFSRKNNNIKSSIVLRMVVKPNVHLINLKQILVKYHLENINKGFSILIDKFKPIAGDNFYVSESAIKDVKFDAVSNILTIETIPETLKKKPQN